MKIKTFCLSVLFSTALIAQPTLYADDSTLATEQLAEIIVKMNSKPAQNDKLTLEDIARDTGSTANERTLARSIINMDNKVRQEDKPSIMRIWLSPAASETERSLAKALLRFDQTVDDKSKETLSQLSK